MAPRVGHLNRLKGIYGYLLKMKHSSIRIRAEEAGYSDLLDNTHDSTYSVYSYVEELLPIDAPEPLGNYGVTLTHYVDTNLMHDIAMGRSVTGILHLVSKTPIEWYEKKQATVETSTYGSEFVAARICTEQIIDLHNTWFLGVPVVEKSYMFGDSKYVVDSSMQLNAKLHKWHTFLSFHRIRKAIAAGILGFFFLSGDDNPADILSKHWGYTQVRER
jgi:hypothetical protein